MALPKLFRNISHSKPVKSPKIFHCISELRKRVSESFKSISGDPNIIHWIQYFNFGYRICVVPYKFILEPGTKTFNIKTTKLQQISCGIFHLFACLYCVSRSYEANVSNKLKSTPTVVFDLMSYFGRAFHVASFLHICWCDKIQTQMLLNNLQIHSQSHELKYKSFTLMDTLKEWLIKFAIFCYVFQGIFFVTKIGIDEELSYQANETKNCFQFLPANLQNIMPYFLIMLEQSLHIFQNSADVLFVLVGVHFQAMVNHFANELKSNTLNPKEVFKRFDSITNIVEDINSLVGNVVFAIGIGTLADYCKSAVELLQKGITGFLSPELALPLCNLSGICIAASASFKLTHELEKWIKRDEHHNSIQSSELKIMLHHISLQNIGLSGKNFFTITYKFIGSFLGLLATYVIILIQLEIVGPAKKLE